MASESATGRSSTELPTTKSRSPSPVHSVSSSSSPPNNDISPAPDDVNEQMLLEPSPSDRDEVRFLFVRKTILKKKKIFFSSTLELF